jgi:hypothetical protein
MDIDVYSIIRNFIKRFVLEDIREKVSFEFEHSEKRKLFISKLNRNWESVLDMRCMRHLDPKLDTHDLIIKELKLEKLMDLCYVISNYSDIDDKVMEGNYALENIYGRGLGSIIVNLPADTIYLETEMKDGIANRFIGKIEYLEE